MVFALGCNPPSHYHLSYERPPTFCRIAFMHRFQSSSVILRIRIASLLVLAFCLLIPTTLGGLAYALLSQNRELALYSLALIPLTLLVVLLKIFASTRTHCPLCMTPVLGDKSCNKHRNARTIFGSYKLRVALCVLFLNSFRCPYCNERSVLKLRGKR
jgi:hypothetical protein